MNSNILTRQQQYAVVILSVTLSLVVVWAAAFGATTISTNVSTGGTLTVTSTSALTGLATLTGGYISVASSSVVGSLHLASMIQASSTATSTFAGGILLYSGCFMGPTGGCIGQATSTSANNIWTGVQTFNIGGLLSTASSTFSTGLMTSGPLQASSTLLVTGASTLSSTLGVTSLATLTGGYISVASSTAVSHLNVSGQLNASSTLSVDGTVTFSNSLTTATSTATTTIALQADSTNEGSCIQMRSSGANGKIYRLYISPGDVGSYATSTSGKAGFLAVWEAGSCQ